MINKEELKGLKYYLGYGALVLAFFVYSGMTGWKWFNPTKTESTRSTHTTHRAGYYIRNHK